MINQTDLVQSTIQHTQKWLSTVIIEHAICPFAKQEYLNNRIHYEVIEATDLQTQLELIIMQCVALDNDYDRETSLLIFPESLSDFEDYLDLLEITTDLFEKQGYDGVFQLASFHPNYCFNDASLDDPSNYTNRSPYPMLHILREASVEKAVANYPNPENIPDRNIQLTTDLGLKTMKKLLADCYK